jgi:hypothetical protein
MCLLTFYPAGLDPARDAIDQVTYTGSQVRPGRTA